MSESYPQTSVSHPSPLLHYQLTAPPTPQLSFQPEPGAPRDSIVESIVAKFHERSAVGWKKYGTTLDREDLSMLDWIQHAQEELMDGILYLEKLKKVYTSKESLKLFTGMSAPETVTATATAPSVSTPAAATIQGSHSTSSTT